MKIEGELYNWFFIKRISNRDELRSSMDDCLKLFPELNQQIVEGYFSKYKQLAEAKEQKVAVISDLHIPFHNEEFLRNFCSFLYDNQPTKIVICGDMVDFYDLSRFDKDPERIGVLQEELDSAHQILGFMRNAAPNAEIIYIPGNHEERLEKFLWKNPQIASLRDLKLERLLRLDELDNVSLCRSYSLCGILFTHGELVRKHSGYSAKAEFDKYLQSGVSGHTHRLGSYFNKTPANGDRFWLEIGCACNLNPQYVENPNWQNGFAVITIADGIISPQLVKATDSKFIYNGKIYW